jgi:iturin family lipopeptide synthetase A
MTTSQVKDENGITRREALVAKLRTMTGPLLHVPPAQIDVDARFLEMGADSLVLIEAVRTIEETFGITLTIQQLFEDVTSLADLAAYLDRMLPPDVIVAEPAAPPTELAAPDRALPAPPIFSLPKTSELLETAQPMTALEQLFTQQLQIIAQQLELLKGNHPLQPFSPIDQNGHDPAPTATGEFVEIEL